MYIRGFKIARKLNEITEEQKTQILKLHKKNKSIMKIVESTGATQTTVRTVIKNNKNYEIDKLTKSKKYLIEENYKKNITEIHEFRTRILKQVLKNDELTVKTFSEMLENGKISQNTPNALLNLYIKIREDILNSHDYFEKIEQEINNNNNLKIDLNIIEGSKNEN